MAPRLRRSCRCWFSPTAGSFLRIRRAPHVSHPRRVAPGSGGPSGAALAFWEAVKLEAGAATASVGNQLDEPVLWAAEPIAVGENGARGLSIALRRAIPINGRVEFVGSAQPPNAQTLARTAIFALTTNADAAGTGRSGIGRVTDDGTFQIRGVVPGRYAITGQSPGWPTLKSVVVAGVDVTDVAIDVETADVNNVVVTFTDTPMATLSGTVAGGERGAGEDVSVLVFPADQRYWTDPAAATRRFRSAPVSRRATFTVPSLAAGEYFVSVVPDAVASEWQQAARLIVLARAATRVTLGEGEKKTIEARR